GRHPARPGARIVPVQRPVRREAGSLPGRRQVQSSRGVVAAEDRQGPSARRLAPITRASTVPGSLFSWPTPVPERWTERAIRAGIHPSQESSRDCVDLEKLAGLWRGGRPGGGGGGKGGNRSKGTPGLARGAEPRGDGPRPQRGRRITPRPA